MNTRLDKRIVPQIATYIGRDHFSIDALTTYKERGLALGRTTRTLPSRGRTLAVFGHGEDDK